MNKLSDKKYVAFFDLDHTILNVSSGALIIRYLSDKGFLRFKHQFHFVAATILAKARLITQHQAMSIIIRLWKNLSLSETIEGNEVFFQEYIVAQIRDGAQREISRHRTNNAAVVLLSASIPSICEKIGDYFDLDDILCTRLEIRNGIYTGKIDGRYCHGKEKAVQAELWCRSNGFSLKDAWYYGDDYEDRHILSIVGNPCCVTPDKKLAKLGLEKKWNIFDWH